MFAGSLRSRGQRRAIVLVVVLAMLGILALIGVTFATFSGQARTSARNYALSQTFPQSEEVMDFGLAQLITDTGNPVSALRGHSLLRDMYGNDGASNGYLTGRPDNGQALTLSGASAVTTGQYAGTYMVTTNIASNDPAFYSYNFTRWVLRFPPTTSGSTFLVSESFEIIADDTSGASRVFYVTPPDTNTPKPAYSNYVSPLNPNVSQSQLIGLQTGYPFVLDGRYLRAFNGPGMTSFAQYGNFRFNGQLQNTLQSAANIGPLGSPDNVGMDEDYDACDLENWFLAIQSADGTMVIPSFHRPGILVYDLLNPNPVSGITPWNDWNDPSFASMAKILRPRAADGHSSLAFPDLNPSTTPNFNYDVDNDADGTTDSVWLDLGYPARRDATGRMFKPMYAFMVIGLNGRIPLNTAGNLQARNNTGSNMFTHAAHLGNSPSEIDPTFALQNASTNTGFGQTGQADNAGIGVNITQLRNLLTGTRPQSSNNSLSLSAGNLNLDANWVAFAKDVVSGVQQYFYFPNNLADAGDLDPTTYTPGIPPFYTPLTPSPTTFVVRGTPAVAGRYGEPDAIPVNLGLVPTPPPTALPFLTPVGAGLAKNSIYSDVQDDNFNTYDPWPSATAGENADMYDPAGLLALPVERIRRYINPIDVAGDGAVTSYNTKNNFGPDIFGRVSFLLYFRPPGVPLAYTNAPPSTPDPVSTPAVPAVYTANNYILNTFVQGAGGLGGTYTANTYAANSGSPGTTLNASTAIYPFDVTNNLLHAYEAARNPNRTNQPTPLLIAGMPADVDPNSGMPQQVDPYSGAEPLANFNTVKGFTPTYNFGINTNLYGTFSTTPPVLLPSPNLNEADEVNVYAPNQYDQVFGPSDLEWLYRNQDTDGGSLSSRLQYLAPISFTNPNDGTRRCRLFSIDTWETTNAVWANDNPGGTFPNNSSAFNVYGAASQYANSGFGAMGYYTPQLAQRERKINLNYPLPVSSNPYEPIRLKWISNTYQTLKAILPPLAVDTPQELAQLSQYVINIIDFRDPDCTTTIWTNPDVVVAPPVSNTTAASPPILYSSNTSSPFAVPTTTPVTTTIPLVQFGMEYNPIAINEVLAYSFLHKDMSSTTPSGTLYGIPTNRFFVELVNTLTQSNATADPSILDLTSSGNWQLVIANDDNVGRPDPVTGQDPSYFFGSPTFPPATKYPPATTPVAGTTYAPFWTIPLNQASFAQPATPNTAQSPQPIVLPPLVSTSTATAADFSSLYKTALQPQAASTATGTAPSQTAFNYYFVLGNAPPAIQSKTGNNTATASTLVNGTTIIPCENLPPDQTLTPTVSGGINAPQQILVLNGTGTGATVATPPIPVFDPFDTNWDDPYYQASPANPIPPPAPGKAQYYWLYLRRTANPYQAHDAAANPWVVVDSMRFPFIEGGGIVTKIDPAGVSTSDTTLDNVMPGPTGLNALYSVQRLQPFRGGHAVPPVGISTTTSVAATGNIPASLSTTVAAAPGPINTAYGYSEQVVLPTNQSLNAGYFGATPGAPSANLQKITSNIYHTLGVTNGYGATGNIDPEWDYLPFNDRDFTSVAELLLVPGCPPGLFTKQFVEEVPYVQTSLASPLPTSTVYPLPTAANVPKLPPVTFPGATYTAGTYAANVNGGTTVQTAAPGTWTLGKDYSNPFNFYASSGYGALTNYLYQVRQPHTYPYLSDNFYYSGASSTTDVVASATTPPAFVPVIGGPSGAGWHKMLEFFEVPSTAIGAVGTADQGMNYDWMRQDLKPGLLNLNLIIDEEVFCGLMGGNTRQNGTPQTDPVTPLDTGGSSSTPNVIIQVNGSGAPTAAGSVPLTNIGYNGTMHQAFNDFLILRHGGSGKLFWWTSGGSAERPFHALSYPDIDYTVMRPAALPPLSSSTKLMIPNTYTVPQPPPPTTPTPVPAGTTTIAYPASQYYPAPVANDPGVKNVNITNYGAITLASPNTSPYTVSWNLYPSGGAKQYALPEPIPARRLFQIPDAFNGLPTSAYNGSLPPVPPLLNTAVVTLVPPSNASVGGDPFVNKQLQVTPLQNNNVDLTAGQGSYLGNSTVSVATLDRRQSPYFRTEWLQRMLNLTTVRTHQFAVWITVGFFEVTRQGDPAYANDPVNFALSYDILGNELTSTSGATVRYRSFFIVDRTKAAGYNATMPSDFRTCVLYRQTIQ